MERIVKQKSIGSIFAYYIICFCLTTVLLVISIYLLFWLLICKGIILPANYYQNYIEQNKDVMIKTDDIKSIIPEECKYVLYNPSGLTLQSNTSENDAKKMWKAYTDNRTSDGDAFYKVIHKQNNIIIVEYKLKARFANSNIQKYTPYAEDLPLLLDVILFIIEIIIFSKSFKNRLSKEMQILKETTQNIQMENLDFDIKYSKIIEINEVLFALSKMKTELKDSLDKQWRIEETQKEQVAALAHDIKTPLTILRGNAELMDELDLVIEQRTFITNIINESMKMESYIKVLIEIIKSNKEFMLEKKEINLIDFIQSIEEYAGSMAREKHIKFIKSVKGIPQKIMADRELLERAVINVISNAINYTPDNGQIFFTVTADSRYIRFIVKDTGKGFTEEELQCATTQFYQGDKSRNSNLHYGIGLYIAKEALKQHNGNILLRNSTDMGGAVVTLELPVG